VPHQQLRRTRGARLVIDAPRKARRRCPSPSVAREPRPPANRFDVELERLSIDACSLRMSGELDLAALPSLDSALRRAERWGAGSIVVDAEDVAFIDLSAVARLAGAHRYLSQVGGGLLVIHPPECLLRVLELMEELDVPVLR
jgi:anti-anti-sigma factor